MGQHRLAWAMLVLVAIGLVVPSFEGWFHDDDLQNMRWVIEYRDAPWRALTDRHSLHDHIRPATLWAGWLGAQISNGAWWGPHLVSVGLLLGAWVGLAVLVSRLMDSAVAGLLTAALILDLEGFRMLLDWDSWVNTAGEMCFGLWGLILVHRALRLGAESQVCRKSLAGALVCLIISGLFKEPGWVIYPSVAALMGVGALRRGDSRQTPLMVIGFVLVGVVGFLWSHTTANVDRLGSELDVLEKIGDLKHAIRPWADVWPATGVSRGWKGIALPLVALAISAAVVLRRTESPTEGQGRAIILGCVGLTGLGYVRPDLVGFVIGLGLIIMSVVHRSGLVAVMVVLTCGVMFLFPGPNPVQILLGAMGFAALVAIHSARLVGPGTPQALRLFSGIIITGGLVLQALQLGDRLVSPEPSPRNASAQLKARVQLLSEAALFSHLGVSRVFYSGDLGPRMLAPVVGFQVIPYNPDFEPYSMQVRDTLWVALDGASLTAAMLEGNLLDEHRAGGHPGALELTLQPGYYVVGMSLVNGEAQARITVTSSCMDDVTVTNTGSGTSWLAVPFRLPDGCETVSVVVLSGREGQVESFFLTQLTAPEFGLRSAEFHAPLLGLDPVEAMPEKH